MRVFSYFVLCIFNLEINEAFFLCFVREICHTKGKRVRNPVPFNIENIFPCCDRVKYRSY